MVVGATVVVVVVVVGAAVVGGTVVAGIVVGTVVRVGATVVRVVATVVAGTVLVGRVAPGVRLQMYERFAIRQISPCSITMRIQPAGQRLENVFLSNPALRLHSTGPVLALLQPRGH